jgi:hypothetical protein
MWGGAYASPPQVERQGVSNAPRDYYVTVWRLQRAELFEDQEPQNDTGPSGTEEVLQPMPQAHAAQRSEIDFVIL